ncbi:hypothetical protein IGI04_025482 [Brassica rapa subsp. trilocularis]|uniref:RNase H type-1 domain-containing protein n=1 Tax=Brassica rapa subsp. trilocularis TaxID=1813537 RepID=A0ABQ7KT73_BRACM|nr:hypothetical protein IGI04_025482 [Brassica rapa subsp. trilocularis]
MIDFEALSWWNPPHRTGALFLRLLWQKLWRLKLQLQLQSLPMLAASLLTPTPKNLILLLKTQGQDVALRAVLHDIHVLYRSFVSISFKFIPRLANVQADSLAKAALLSLSFAASDVVD